MKAWFKCENKSEAVTTFRKNELHELFFNTDSICWKKCRSEYSLFDFFIASGILCFAASESSEYEYNLQ